MLRSFPEGTMDLALTSKHSNAHSFINCLQLLLLDNGRVDFATETMWPAKLKVLIMWPFIEKAC